MFHRESNWIDAPQAVSLNGRLILIYNGFMCLEAPQFAPLNISTIASEPHLVFKAGANFFSIVTEISLIDINAIVAA